MLKLLISCEKYSGAELYIVIMFDVNFDSEELFLTSMDKLFHSLKNGSWDFFVLALDRQILSEFLRLHV